MCPLIRRVHKAFAHAHTEEKTHGCVYLASSVAPFLAVEFICCSSLANGKRGGQTRGVRVRWSCVHQQAVVVERRTEAELPRGMRVAGGGAREDSPVTLRRRSLPATLAIPHICKGHVSCTMLHS